MTARFATSDEIARWDELIINNPDGGNVFSSFVYSHIKKLGEYKALFVIIDSLAVTILEKKTPPLGNFWYLPKGPNVSTSKQLFDTLKALEPFAREHGAFVVRIESELPRDIQPTLSRHGLKKAAPIIPNPSTITLDISPKLDELLMNLPQKGRHAIRRAERDGVTVEQVDTSEKNCKTMYKLLSETAEGQFGIRSYSYYKSFWQQFASAGKGQLFFAYFEGKVVAGAYAMVYGKKSTYKDGASIRKRTVYGASHLLQWHVIEWAKSQGALIHDFCGSPPSDEIDNPAHPHHGIGLFKRSFSKHVVDFIGCYDLVISPVKHKAWVRLGERVYRHYYYKRTNDYYY
ncbi:MAG: putative Methicillin resistance protein [Candidatus Saccharibacteria bacterium]|nr:putative Methicillin resistance protein [Candidatus Saccharibacteria bacterium]